MLTSVTLRLAEGRHVNVGGGVAGEVRCLGTGYAMGLPPTRSPRANEMTRQFRGQAMLAAVLHNR